MTFRREYNGCKSFGCPNCGVPDLSLYSRSNRLGYDAWHCPECGAYPPVLINEPILALAHQLQQQTFELKLLPHCECRLPAWQRYGRTAVGSPRVKCRCCQKTATLLNPNKESHTLQPLLDALLTEVSPKDLQYKLGLNHRRFSQYLERLASMLDTFSRLYERHLSFSNIQLVPLFKWRALVFATMVENNVQRIFGHYAAPMPKRVTCFCSVTTLGFLRQRCQSTSFLNRFGSKVVTN